MIAPVSPEQEVPSQRPATATSCVAFTTTQKVLFRHCDPAGIVFYPRYFEIINDSVETFFDEIIGLPFEVMHRTHGVPTVKISAEFQAVSRHGDVLTITVTPRRLGRSSVDLAITGTCADQTRFHADATLVFVSNAMKSSPWPEDVRACLARQLDPETKEATDV